MFTDKMLSAIKSETLERDERMRDTSTVYYLTQYPNQLINVKAPHPSQHIKLRYPLIYTFLLFIHAVYIHIYMCNIHNNVQINPGFF